MATIAVQAECFDVAAESARLTESRTDIGAVVTFTGLCRDEAGTLAALEIEHYPSMAEAGDRTRRRDRRGPLATGRLYDRAPVRQNCAG